MKIKLAILALLTPCLSLSAQTYETHFARPLSDVIKSIERQFGVRLKCSDVDTTGLMLRYADFRLRPYSLEETLQNVLSPFDFVAVYQNKTLWKVKPYDYTRRKPADGRKMIAWLNGLYTDKAQWEARRDTLQCEVRQRLGLDELLSQCVDAPMTLTKKRRHNGYTVQNFSLSTVNGHTVKGSIYAPVTRGKHPLIICPNGHFANGRYGEVQQQRLGTLARMGAICVDYDLWGWGESAEEVGTEAHHTAEAHVMQIVNGLRILDEMLQRKDVDPSRVGVNGGSGGGTQTVLLATLDNRFTAANPVVSLSSWFDGGCPCESGKPIQLAAGGTCNAELAATFAPKPMMVVSDGGDWTSTTPELEFPYLQRIYAFYGASDKVQNIHLPKERHDFGPNKRNAVYKFFIDVFQLDGSQLDESLVTIEDEHTLRYNPKATK